MAFTTKITELLGIEHPIVQGGMMWVGTADMAAAVSNGGGLGMITSLTQPAWAELIARIMAEAETFITGRVAGFLDGKTA